MREAASEHKRMMLLKMMTILPAAILSAAWLVTPIQARADIILSTGQNGISHFSPGAFGSSSDLGTSLSSTVSPLPRLESLPRSLAVKMAQPAARVNTDVRSARSRGHRVGGQITAMRKLPIPIHDRRLERSAVARAATAQGVDGALVRAVIAVESGHRPHAVSPKGAVGLMQLLPSTARQYGVADRFDPVQNVNGGTRYLKHLLSTFNGDLRLALAAYNAGEGNVMRFGRTVPPFQETRQYVMKVLAIYRQVSVR